MTEHELWQFDLSSGESAMDVMPRRGHIPSPWSSSTKSIKSSISINLLRLKKYQYWRIWWRYGCPSVHHVLPSQQWSIQRMCVWQNITIQKNYLWQVECISSYATNHSGDELNEDFHQNFSERLKLNDVWCNACLVLQTLVEVYTTRSIMVHGQVLPILLNCRLRRLL